MTENTTKEGQRTNPFLLPYNTPHNTVPFGDITLADYEEAMLEEYAERMSRSTRQSTTPKNQPSTIPSSEKTR